MLWLGSISSPKHHQMLWHVNSVPLFPSSSCPSSPIHAAGERRCKWTRSRKYQSPLPNTAQVTARRAVKSLFGLIRFSWQILGTLKPIKKKKWRPHLYCIHYLHSNAPFFTPSTATSVIVKCLLIYQHLPHQSSGKPQVCPWETGLSVFQNQIKS